ncbi:sporulation inhibitor of replication protein SirA [Aquisalibacillus elongatus]|uniref:Uncharacterized protein DUF2522 n=1 Tax=Aquisalibacillus elongatus TaxID=485577 RepID=A0A3N5BDY6_9BACI|nr:sporulation inhibitor of replication protein SirA [Aquisalibacillus elongatus]RPF55906.1 uncharacterized protein DUF2522 [Aquisalibacillus elongatus]
MYQYSLYLFKSDYAQHFYYKIDTVYRFLYEQLLEYPEEARSQYKLVLDKINTKDLYLHLNDAIDHELTLKINRDQIMIGVEGQFINIEVDEYVLTIHAQSIIDLDQLLFQYLKSFHPHIFAVNFETFECGWITPFAGKEIYSL